MLLYFWKIKLFSRTKPSTDNSFTHIVEKYKLLNLVETLYRPKLPKKKITMIKENYQIGWIEAENSGRNIYAMQKWNKPYAYLHFHEELIHEG